MTFDVIGDIHGHADELRALLARLGYEERNGAYSAANRKAIFIGDFIDRGPKIREVLEIVRAMVTRDAASAVMGNHEFNAICYHTPDDAGGFLRAHSPKNNHQHQATIEQLAAVDPEEWRSHLEWFKGLPLFLEIEGLRVVHASWDESLIRIMRGRSFHDPDVLTLAASKGTSEFQAVERLLKGPEISLPEGHSCDDKEGVARTEMRVAWWRSRPKKKRVSYSDLSMPNGSLIPDVLVPASVLESLPSYGRREPPVIFGHYALISSSPSLLERNAACIDYNIARDGFLTAYSWTGEKQLKQENFAVAPRAESTPSQTVVETSLS
jgi:hypothetical protein